MKLPIIIIAALLAAAGCRTNAVVISFGGAPTVTGTQAADRDGDITPDIKVPGL